MSHGPNAAKRRRIRRQLAKRDGMACFYCGCPFASLAEATIDHLVPRSLLPTWVQANLVLACLPCNQAKGDRLPQELLRPWAYGPGLVPADRRTAPGPVRRVVPDGPHGRTETAPAGSGGPSPLVRCGRCEATCERDRLADEPLRWLVPRPEIGGAYCWRCVSAIADELLLLTA